ncbi:DNA-directed RNA polymerase sigma-70 factor [Asanoa ishikariensis]|uniref:RNA polymerase sigma-70 factor, sigma-E family n=1 Tax=Asanoa ishikariensis TaxID=137265 RepID=A0A1H3MX21_9ACTN|nr:SigE family RNA polymerase sigma factor [Asanoa ishikariensis]GIF66390.1 DNA-directed RNA polymerase sigma-70 factor [Asanoa ishikariensis]SDY81044.1 RNA polymerase sigma-70 factor, sigma-E family [Asanoa ishikariensis]
MTAGDAEFVEFARAASARLVHAAFLMTGDHHRAEDAAQTALVRTYASWSRIREGDAYGYARSVLVNHLVDGWRRPIREYPTEDLPEQHRGDVADEVTTRRWLVAVLGALSPRERAIVVLRYYFDLAEAKVAEELGVSLGTVKSTSSRALEKLRAAGIRARETQETRP